MASVRESGVTIYLNFGWHWSQDFAVTVLKRNERNFAAPGLDLKKLTGRRVRVRGFIEARGTAGSPRFAASGANRDHGPRLTRRQRGKTSDFG